MRVWSTICTLANQHLSYGTIVCMHNAFIIESAFKAEVGHPCLFNCIILIEEKTIFFVIFIFVDDLLVAESCVCEIEKVMDSE